jgi:uncharacterized protein
VIKHLLLNGRGLHFALLLIIALLGFGCKKPAPRPLSGSAIHNITRELRDAAKTAAPAGSEIRGSFQATDSNPKSADHLDIAIFSKGSDDAARPAIASVQQALTAVATSHGLAEEPAESREGILFFYKHAGVVTHSIHIHVTSKAASGGDNTAGRLNGAKLAIILDDLGNDRPAAEQIFALHYPLTISVLPNHPHSVDIAEDAHRRGYEVMLHLPMESIGKEKPELQELKPGMHPAEIASLVGQFLQNVPEVIGVNNHEGSEATADKALMSELMPVLRERNLFYIDSRTTATTVAFETAQQDGVRAAFRNVPFLDDVAEVPAVRKQLELALRGAREKGEAVAIGHPHPATLEALREILPQAKAQGVRLVFASELVH